MKIIDANTGAEVKVGQTFRNIDGVHTLLEVRHKGLFGAKARFHTDGRDIWVPLAVRYTHPSFFLRKVAFIPS